MKVNYVPNQKKMNLSLGISNERAKELQQKCLEIVCAIVESSKEKMLSLSHDEEKSEAEAHVVADDLAFNVFGAADNVEELVYVCLNLEGFLDEARRKLVLRELGSLLQRM